MSKRRSRMETAKLKNVTETERRIKAASNPMQQFKRMTKSLGESLNKLIAVHGKLNYLMGMAYQFIVQKPGDESLYKWLTGLTGGWFRDQLSKLIKDGKDYDADIYYLNGEHAIDREKWESIEDDWESAIRLFTQAPHDSTRIRELMLNTFNDPDLLGGLIEFTKTGTPAGARDVTVKVVEYARELQKKHETPFGSPNAAELWKLFKEKSDTPIVVKRWMKGKTSEALKKAMQRH